MQIHELKPTHKNKEKKRIGRGVTRGKTSGRGHKGQKARAGAKIRPAMRDVIKRIPKKRGHGIGRSQAVVSEKTRPQEVGLGQLNDVFENGDQVTPNSLIQKGLVDKKSGKTPTVKILGNGELNKKLEVTNCFVSASAKESIEKVGGEIL